MQMEKTGNRTSDLQVGGQPLYPSVKSKHSYDVATGTQKPPVCTRGLKWHFQVHYGLKADENICTSPNTRGDSMGTRRPGDRRAAWSALGADSLVVFTMHHGYRLQFSHHHTYNKDLKQ
ncbi:unnamed protein product [Pleuronectes platessa]|uniref:Uncharacterized protein n=1 Tax=Pleuronectes platessa TaxID=8262 RepID=A0A9N7TYC5_PLEPL|nr:unnamed protein product [Pleuronectes platessa]